MLTISGGRIINPDKVIEKGKITLDNGKIISLTVEGTGEEAENQIQLKETDLIFPGFIDLHVHGSGGVDVMTDTEAALKEIASFIAKFGVTGWLPTTYSAPIVDMADIGAAASWLLSSKNFGAEVLGIHHEGPFISIEKRGAHPETGVLSPDLSQLEELVTPASVSIVTLAPELPLGLEMIKILKDKNVIASIGHTNANYEQCQKGIDAGATYATHCFNGMSGFSHHNPGALGALMINDSVVCEVIADLHHVHPAAIKLLVKAKGADKTVLITDAIAPTGLGEGTYMFAGQHVQVKNGQVKLEDGTFAGSVLTMDQAVKNVVEVVGISLPEVAQMASTTPAKVLGLENKRGQIKEGFEADLSILDQNFTPLYTIVGGNMVYQKDMPKDNKSEKEINEESRKAFEKFLNENLDTEENQQTPENEKKANDHSH